MKANFAFMNKVPAAKASISVKAPVSKVWDALITPELIKQYMFGTTVISNWKEGSSIVWKGQWEGKSYEDKGVILKLQPQRLIQYSHFSPLSGVPDVPENYHRVTIELSTSHGDTLVSITQDNNESEDVREHSEKGWAMMLSGLKKVVET